MRISNRFEKHIVAATAVAMSAAAANASVVNWNCNLVIPFTQRGLYINVETQDYSSSQVAGWDINPYGNSTITMSWFGPTIPSGCVMGLGQGGTTVAVASLSVGTLVSGDSTFGFSGSSVTNGGWMLNAANNFGFQFLGGDGLTHYGYGVMTIGANMGVRTLNSVSYESVAGVGITVVPAPGALALLGLAGIPTRRQRS